MGILFVNCYSMSKERYLSWAKNPVKKSKIKLIWNVLIFFITVTMLQATLSKGYLLIPFYLVLIAFCIYKGYFQTKVMFLKQYKANAAAQGKGEWERIIKMSDCIDVEDGNVNVKYQWDQVSELIESKNEFIFVFKNASGIRLDKNGFKDANYEAFLAFIKGKFENIPIK